MKLIVGLGNPGREYVNTRHNIGFMVVQELAEDHGIKFRRNRRFRALTGEGVVVGENSYLAMPQTFMNLSGHSIRSIINWLKIEFEDMMLVVDDIALPFGTIRIKPKGSDAGHKGTRSAIGCLGTSEFPRMRIGISGCSNMKNLSGYVLSRFTKSEQKILPGLLRRASQACECWIKEDIDAAMNRYNGGYDE